MHKNLEEFLSQEARLSYQRDGALLVKGIFYDWLNVLERGAEFNLAHPGPHASINRNNGGYGMFFDDYCNWQRIPEFRDFILHSPAAELAGLCMGAQTSRILTDHLIVKQDGISMATPWHHDITYMNVTGNISASIWVALDHAEAGIAPEFIAGSHLWSNLFRPKRFQDGEDYDDNDNALNNMPTDLENYPKLSWDVEPGDALLFHFKIVHGTSSRKVTGRRTGFSTRWMGEDIRFAGMPNKLPFPWNNLEPGAQLPEEYCPVLWQRT